MPIPQDWIVWAGRHRAAIDAGLDEWTCDLYGLYQRLDAADGLVVLDAFSLPWESLRPEDWNIPLRLVLPSEFGPETLEHVLGDIVLRHLTPFDHVLSSRHEVQSHLTVAYGVPVATWVDASGEGPQAALDELAKAPAGQRRAKETWRSRTSELSRAVREALTVQPSWSRALVVASDERLGGAIRAATGADVTAVRWDHGHLVDGDFGIVVVADLEAVEPKRRDSLLKRVLPMLRVPGRLIAQAIVVSDPCVGAAGGDSVPGLPSLLLAFESVTGQGLHIEDLRAVRLGREPLRRCAILQYTRMARSAGW